MAAYYESFDSGKFRRQWSVNAKILAGALAALVVVVGVILTLGPGPAPGAARLVWIAEKTTRVSAGMPASIRARAKEIGIAGGGEFTAWAVGQRAYSADTEDLGVLADGDRVTDEDKVAKALKQRLDNAVAKVGATLVEDQGFSLYAALRVAADEARAAHGPVEVWLSTTVFSGSVDPLTITALTGADPGQAVEELMKGSLGDLDLSGVNLHPVLMTPIGDGQRPLSPRSESWRAAFLTSLAEHMHAVVSDPVHDNTIGTAWPGSSTVSAIDGLQDPPPSSPNEDPRIDNAAFQPDSAALADPDVAERAVDQVVAAYRRSPGVYRIEVTGYCAQFGDADGANRTSAARAEAVAALLRGQGVANADITPQGLGFQQRADPTQDPRSPAQRVVVLRLVKRP
jgi:outer membrane protein OmpA-like peptidoglycan-associated protein